MLTFSEESVLSCIKENKGRTATQLLKVFNCEEDLMRDILIELVKKKKIWPKNCIWTTRK